MSFPKNAEEQREQQWERYETENAKERRPRFVPVNSGPGIDQKEIKRLQKIINEIEDLQKRILCDKKPKTE